MIVRAKSRVLAAPWIAACLLVSGAATAQGGPKFDNLSDMSMRAACDAWTEWVARR